MRYGRVVMGQPCVSITGINIPIKLLTGNPEAIKRIMNSYYGKK